MKKFNFMAVAAGLLILSSPAALMAADTSDNKPAEKPGTELREKSSNTTPEERRQKIREKNKAVLERAGLNPEEMKNLPPSERRAKVKEVIDKRVADLEKKKSDGTGLTEQEQSDLDTLSRMKGMMDHAGQHGARQPKAQKPSGDVSK